MDTEQTDKKDREEAAQPQNQTEEKVNKEENVPEENQAEKQGGNPENTELEKTQEELKKQKEILLRTAAEYDNYRKRTEREKTAVYTDATSAAVAEFLAVADNLERALEQKECNVEDLRKGVEMVQTQMLGALTKLGVTSMGEVGEPFNPDLHNAVSHVEDENAGENTIAQVFQKGYKIGDKVIRHAMVQVAN